MAETRRQNKIITKGLKLPVTIEDAIEDALIVCLDYGARKYRGILLDTNKRYREIHLFVKGFHQFSNYQTSVIFTFQWSSIKNLLSK
jgi:hypothetical protein